MSLNSRLESNEEEVEGRPMLNSFRISETVSWYGKNTPHVYDWPPYDKCIPFYNTNLVVRVLLFLGGSSKVSFYANTAQVVKSGPLFFATHRS